MKTTGILAVLVALSAGLAGADDWPQWRGPNRDGVSQETGWLDQWPPAEAWRVTVGPGFSSVAVSGGRVYTLGYHEARSEEVVYCLDASTGTQVWSFAFSSGDVNDANVSGSRSTPTVVGDEVYIYGQRGYLHCLDKATGASLWNKTVNTGRHSSWGLSSSPLVVGDLVIVNAGKTGTAIRRSGAHDTVWDSSGTAAYSSPVLSDFDGRPVVVVVGSSGVVGRDPEDGATLWSYSWSSSFNIADPVLYGDRVFVSTGYSKGCALITPESGTSSQHWRNSNLRNHLSNCVRVGDYVYGFDGQQSYGGTGSTRLRCLNLRDGSVEWTQNMKSGSLTAVGDKLVVIDEDGNLEIARASPDGYDTEQRPSVPVMPAAAGERWWTCPVLANGRIYCRSQEGTLVALETAVNPDADGDGMPDAWEGDHFGGTNVPLGGPYEDWDGDGLENLYEWLAGTGPTDADSGLTFGSVGRAENREITVEWQSVSGRVYSIRRGATPGAVGEPISTGIAATPPVNQYTDTASETSGVYQVELE